MILRTPTDVDIETKAREMCTTAGVDPEMDIENGKAWQNYRRAASLILNNLKNDTDGIQGGYQEGYVDGATYLQIDPRLTNVVNVTTTFAMTVGVDPNPSGVYNLTIFLPGETFDMEIPVQWQGGSAPTFTTGMDIIYITYNPANDSWYGSASLGHA